MGLVRLLLALAVVAAHAGPPGGVAWLEMTGGPASVQCFYVISGFYMALILNEKYVGPGSYGVFVRSRLWRLLPMFFVVLAATLLLGWVLHAGFGITIEPFATWREHGPGMPWSHAFVLAASNVTIVGQDLVNFAAVDPTTHRLFFTPDFHGEVQPGWQFLLVPQAWTIALELAFYALAPLLVRRHALWLAVGVLASLGLRVWLMRHFQVRHDPWTYRFFPTELAMFLAGAFAFRAHRSLAARGWLRPSACAMATLLLLGLIAGYRLLPGWCCSAPYGVPLLAAVTTVLLPWVFHGTRESRVDRAIGELSYPVYLVHYLFVFVAGAVAWPWLDRHRGVVLLVVTLAAAWLLWRTVGLPLETRRQRVGERLQPAAPAAGAVATG
jgi:peptidoglycan/LPS O-acetylase OafA/YrhL